MEQEIPPTSLLPSLSNPSIHQSFPTPTPKPSPYQPLMAAAIFSHFRYYERRMVAFFSNTCSIHFLGALLSLLLLLRHANAAAAASSKLPFREAPAFRNGKTCFSSSENTTIHIAMTLDANYLRGTMAAVLSILQHSTCPENVVFHFLWARQEPEVFSSIRSTFPYLNFKVYHFDITRVRGLISKSIRQALDQPLNYARIYLADILPQEVRR
ncbi:UNVERIFIED_CONTAM: putative galacturonosyltransferase-like 4 [Sesamum angustifolium]|uniref:Hexosyltransferase n=1 Tax=Sesamum angustifolium TaxID=2727405 RepID=A0AAW2QSY1_9LAMI